MINYLREYARFIREQKLEEFVRAELRYLGQYEIPLMEFFKHLTEEELLATSRAGAEKLLASIETGTSIAEVKENLDNWKNDRIPGIPRNAISLKDITLIYAIQKMALLQFIPEFTTTISIAQQLVTELEEHYIEVRELGLAIFETIRSEEENKRKKSDEMFKDLFDNTNDLIQFLSAEGNIQFVNNAWLKTLGYTIEEVTGKPIFDFVKAENRDDYRRERKKMLIDKAEIFYLKTCYETKDGRNITLEGYISAKLKDGEVEYTRGMLRDITERTANEKKIKAINEQLAEREENLRHLVQHAPDAVIVIDTSSHIQLWNNRAEMIFGWKQEEVIGKDISQVIIPAHLRDAHLNGMSRYLHTGESKLINNTAEVPALTKDGKEITISLTMSTSKQGGNLVFIAFLRDITIQKKNELELENKRQQLEKTNQELEQYAWLTSHDLKEPVRKILTFSDALMKRKTNDADVTDSNYLKKINDSARRMNALIEAVLQYSNVSNEETLFTLTDLSATLQDVLEDLEIVIEAAQATIHADPLPVINAIPVQMRQLFQNLVTNALKYCKPGEPPVITISSRPVSNGIRIEVRDNGLGFENAYAHKIFQVFQRLLSSKAYEGTGIGLALCKKIVDKHNGNIYAESEPGVGSVFIIILPLNPLATPAV